MRTLTGVIVGFLGAITAFIVTVVLVYVVLGNEDALVWVTAMMFFGFVSLPVGAVVAILLLRRLWPKPA